MEKAILVLQGIMVLGIGALVLFIRNYLPTYAAEKGRNLATKEDIAKITDEVERVKHGYTEIKSQIDRKHQLRMAALDKRLEVHQQAYWEWVKLLRTVYEPKEVFAAAAVAQEWWMQNCLYLEPEVRAAFRAAYMVATDHHRLVNDHGSVALVQDSWKTISQVGDVLVRAVALPPIAGEGEGIATTKPSSGGA